MIRKLDEAQLKDVTVQELTDLLMSGESQHLQIIDDYGDTITLKNIENIVISSDKSEPRISVEFETYSKE